MSFVSKIRMNGMAIFKIWHNAFFNDFPPSIASDAARFSAEAVDLTGLLHL